jgi:hypothetical protein
MTAVAKGNLYFGVMIVLGVIATGILVPASLTAFSQIFQNKADIAANGATVGELIKMIERSQKWEDRYGPMISEMNGQVKQLTRDPHE